jgi:Bifunctional DNA primase/polymerase, N-terminal
MARYCNLSNDNKDSNNIFNESANNYRIFVGVNVIPADTRNKIPLVKWAEYQGKPIPQEVHDKWKNDNEFDKGMALICGKTWHNKSKEGLFLNCLDIDNQKGLDEFCNRNGIKTPLEELAKNIMIEQHPDDKTRAHIYFYSTVQLPDKSSTVANVSDKNEIPAIEVKSSNKKLAYCTPSPHKNGYNYDIIGTREIPVLDHMADHINNICKKYGIPYLDASGNGTGSKNTNR